MRLHEYITVPITYDYHSTNNSSDLLSLSDAQQHKIPEVHHQLSAYILLLSALHHKKVIVIALLDLSMRAQLL